MALEFLGSSASFRVSQGSSEAQNTQEKGEGLERRRVRRNKRSAVCFKRYQEDVKLSPILSEPPFRSEDVRPWLSRACLQDQISILTSMSARLPGSGVLLLDLDLCLFIRSLVRVLSYPCY